jgi:hypothetical protein
VAPSETAMDPSIFQPRLDNELQAQSISDVQALPWNLFETYVERKEGSKYLRKLRRKTMEILTRKSVEDSGYRNLPQLANRDIVGLFMLSSQSRLTQSLQVFLVDNSHSMEAHRYLCTLLVETLAEELRGCDETGFDLHFTLSVEERRDRKLNAAQNFRDMLLNPSTWSSAKLKVESDMSEALKRVVFDKYLADAHPRKKTLIVVTNGVWGEQKVFDQVEVDIVDFINKLHDHKGINVEDRYFTIQFIRIDGGVQKHVDRLRQLDDALTEKHKLSNGRQFP